MPSYHFDLGDSSTGPIGLCARINAQNKEEALERLKNLLPTEIEVAPMRVIGVVGSGMRGDEYINVYLNPDGIDVCDIDDEDDDEDERGTLILEGGDRGVL